MKNPYNILDIIYFTTSIMDNLDIPDEVDTFFWNRVQKSGWEFYWITTSEKKLEKYIQMKEESWEKIRDLSQEDYLNFLKECDIYIYTILYYEPNAYSFPEDKWTDNYYWVSQFYPFRENTIGQLDFAIEKVTACLEWSKKKDKETNWGMLEWVEKNQKHLDKLLEKRVELRTK